jgi:hypothetical protein
MSYWGGGSGNLNYRKELQNGQLISYNRGCYRWDSVPSQFKGALFPMGMNDRQGDTIFDAAEDLLVGVITDGRQGNPAGGNMRVPDGFKVPKYGKSLVFAGCHRRTTFYITVKFFKKGERVKFSAGKGMWYWFADCAAKHPNIL